MPQIQLNANREQLLELTGRPSLACASFFKYGAVPFDCAASAIRNRLLDVKSVTVPPSATLFTVLYIPEDVIERARKQADMWESHCVHMDQFSALALVDPLDAITAEQDTILLSEDRLREEIAKPGGLNRMVKLQDNLKISLDGL